MKSGTWTPTVKVCGLSCPEDIRAATAAGADAIGFIEAPFSPRAVSSEQVRRLVAMAPTDTVSVAVFVDRSPAFARTWCAEADVRAVQLSGTETPRHWAGFPLPIVRRIAVTVDADLEMAEWADVASAFVLDYPGTFGGSGRTVNWAIAATLARRGPCLLAGGLHSGNVSTAIRVVRPRGVDASSRLEREPGSKDPDLIASFVQEARRAFGEVEA